MAGMILVNVTILSAVASAVLLYATSISNIALVQDAVVVLFLNNIDEQLLMILQVLAPEWVDEVESNIDLITLSRLKILSTYEISEMSNEPSSESEQNLDLDICHVEHDAHHKDNDYEVSANEAAIDCCASSFVPGGDDGAKGDFDKIKEELKFAMDKIKVVEDENAALRERLKILEEEENKNKGFKALEERVKILEEEMKSSVYGRIDVVQGNR